MIEATICICTRRRQPGLKRLLDSLLEMHILPYLNLRIIVVENDSKTYSEEIVNGYSSKCNLRISYFLETNEGLVYARNRSVKEAGICDFCCFVDDDQIVTSEWLVELFKCQEEFNADGVYGCCVPYFNKDVPPYIKKSHVRKKYEYGTILQSAATGGLLLRKKYLDMIEGPFDIRFNFTGGEDSHLTFLISSMGGVIRFNPCAIVYEVIPNNRATINYVLKRAYLVSNVGLFIKSSQNNKFSKPKALPRLILRFCYGLLTFLPCLFFGKTNKLQGLIRIMNSAGGFAFIIGKRSQFYKSSDLKRNE